MRKGPLIVFFTALIASSFPDNPPPLTPASALVGDWFGMTSDEHYLFKLRLENDGKGSLHYVYLEEARVTLPVTSWMLRGRELSVAVNSTQSVLRPIGIKGDVGFGVLQLVISGKDWEKSVRFRRVEEFDRKYGRL